MQLTIDETNRRRVKQLRYNEEHGITPTQIVKSLKQSVLSADDRADIKELKRSFNTGSSNSSIAADPIIEHMTRPQMEKLIIETTNKMKEAARQMDFIQAAQYRDEIIRLKNELELK